MIYMILIWINRITIIYLSYFFRIIVHFSSCIYYVSYPIIFKINVSTFWIRVVLDACIVFVHHREQQIKMVSDLPIVEHLKVPS